DRGQHRNHRSDPDTAGNEPVPGSLLQSEVVGRRSDLQHVPGTKLLVQEFRTAPAGRLTKDRDAVAPKITRITAEGVMADPRGEVHTDVRARFPPGKFPALDVLELDAENIVRVPPRC